MHKLGIAQELRDAALSVRRKSMPLADLIPLMQRAADALDPTLSAPEYGNCLRAVELLMQTDPHLNSPVGRVLDELVQLVEGYEREHFKFLPPPTAEELATFRREQREGTAP